MKLQFLKQKLPTILSAIACVGVVATAVSASKAAVKAEKTEDTGEKIKLFVPTVTMAISTMACICGSNYINRKRQMTLAGAITMLNAEYARYQNAVIETYGEKAHQQMLSMAKCNPPDIWVPGLCTTSMLIPNNLEEDEVTRTFYDARSKRYFETTLSKVLEAQYHYNRDYTGSGNVNFNRFYEYVGLDPVDDGEDVFCVDSGLWWVDFNNHLERLDDGMEVIVIDTEFAPENPSEYDWEQSASFAVPYMRTLMKGGEEMIFGLSAMACLAIVAVVLTAVVQINNIIRKDKALTKRLSEKKND